jgi:hypothetical protein
MGHLAVHAQTVRVVKAVRDAGVDCILLKGVSYEQWLYHDGARPVSRDVDLLVALERFELARSAVAGLGMEATDDPCLFLPSEPGSVRVELHATFHFVGVPAGSFWTVMAANRDQLEVGGVLIDVPSVPARAVLLALHAAFHGRDGHWALEDLRRALEVVSLDEWTRAASLAGELDASAGFAGGLRLLPAGARLADALGLRTPDDPAVLLRAESANLMTFRMLDYAGEPRLAGLARLVGAELFPASDRMRACYPIARRGHTGLVAAHVARLTRLALTSPLLIARWRQARRAAHQGAR